jgi:hypothetical protein
MTYTYILYKNPIQLDTLEIVHYLHSHGYKHVAPACCIERNHPAWVTMLPAIETMGGHRYIGLDMCVQYWETLHGETNLLDKAHKFKLTNPDTKGRSVVAVDAHSRTESVW